MKKRFLFLLVGLNLLIISSISMSLAWFLGSINLNIEDIYITVDVDADLKISLDDNFDNAKTALTRDDVGEIENLIPVSSMTSSRREWTLDKTKQVNTPRFIEQYRRGTTGKPDTYYASKGFKSIPIYLFSDKHMFVTFDSRNNTTARVDRDGKELTTGPLLQADFEANKLKAQDLAEKKAAKNHRAETEKRIAEGILNPDDFDDPYAYVKADLIDQYEDECYAGLNNVTKSVRFSILDYENLTGNYYTIIDPTKTETSEPVVFGGRLSTSLLRDYYDYYRDGDEYKEVLFGDVVGGYELDDLVYLDPVETDTERTDKDGEPSCFNAGTRQGVRPLDMEAINQKFEFYTENSISPEQADVSTHQNDESTGYLIELFPEVAHKLVLSIYLEGWDLDNLDSTQEGSFNMNIRFRLYRQGELE